VQSLNKNHVKIVNEIDFSLGLKNILDELLFMYSTCSCNLAAIYMHKGETVAALETLELGCKVRGYSTEHYDSRRKQLAHEKS
jgi:hypothetical protein